ncbi:hypothetical protein GYA13_01135 [Candidatus Kuenenbacteria bacterium]|nr:hypothetical protein [Candidatus Kuenenbacteria bacterium]
MSERNLPKEFGNARDDLWRKVEEYTREGKLTKQEAKDLVQLEFNEKLLDTAEFNKMSQLRAKLENKAA